MLAETLPVTDPPSRGLSLTQAEYASLLDGLGMYGFPRTVGTPGQAIVGSPASFFRWFELNWSRPVPMFVSHSRFMAPTTSAKFNRDNIIFEWAFGDYDTGDGNGLSPAEVQAEVQKVSAFLIAHRLAHCWKYSGSEGGFHLRVRFREEAQDRRYLERWESAFWRGLKHELQVRSINIKCANPVCMERLPFTRYVHRKNPEDKEYHAEPNYCVPFPWTWARDGKWAEIRDLSFHPRLYEDLVAPGFEPRMSLEAFVRQQGWTAFGHEIAALHPLPNYAPTGAASDLINLYIPEKKCLRELPFGSNPRHAVRFAFVCELLPLGFGLEELVALVQQVAVEAKWEDYKPEITRQQVTHALLADKYKPWTCGKLRENGVCVGPSCGRFRKAFPVEWAEHLKYHPEDVR